MPVVIALRETIQNCRCCGCGFHQQCYVVMQNVCKSQMNCPVCRSPLYAGVVCSPTDLRALKDKSNISGTDMWVHLLLGDHYCETDDTKLSLDQARYHFDKATNGGSAYAAFRLAMLWLYKGGYTLSATCDIISRTQDAQDLVPSDANRALFFFDLASRWHQPDAMACWARFLLTPVNEETGEKVASLKEDAQEATKLLQDCAKLVLSVHDYTRFMHVRWLLCVSTFDPSQFTERFQRVNDEIENCPTQCVLDRERVIRMALANGSTPHFSSLAIEVLPFGANRRTYRPEALVMSQLITQQKHAEDANVLATFVPKIQSYVMANTDAWGYGSRIETVHAFSGDRDGYWLVHIPHLGTTTYRPPSVAGLAAVPEDAVVGGERNKKVKKIQPNVKCPCGSGIKYKKCCGKKRTTKTKG